MDHAAQEQAFKDIAYENVLQQITNRKLMAENAELRTALMTARAELAEAKGARTPMGGTLAGDGSAAHNGYRHAATPTT